MAPPITRLSAAGLSRRIRDGELTPLEVTEAHLERIRERNDRTNAFIHVTDELAHTMAVEAQAAIDSGDPLGPLHGIPIAIKDLYDVAGQPTTRGSLLFENAVADEHGPMVERFIEAGAIIIGKTNLPEFGWGTTTGNRILRPTGTAFDPRRVAGGSSGGAGAALGDSLVPLAQGSDAGGSVRTPASFSGVYGLKPTYGVIPNAGGPNAFISHTPFINQGPMARTVLDAAMMLEVMAGYEPVDPFSVPVETNYRDAVEESIDHMSIAYSPGFGVYPVDPAIRETLDEAIGAFEEAGATIDRISPDIAPDRDEILECYYTFMATLFHSLFDSLEKEGLDPRGEDGSRLDSPLREFVAERQRPSTRQYWKANILRTEIFDAIQNLFEEYDLLVTATLGVLPFPHDSPPTEVDGVPVERDRGWVLTQPYNLTGHPAASIPAGFVDGLPVGMQIAGRRFAERDILAASAALERRRPWRSAYPE